MAGTLPLPAGTAEGRRGTVPFVAQVPAVVVAVADPAAQHAVAVVAAEEGGGAGARGTGVVLVAAVLAVWVAVALPVGRQAAPVRLALELALVVAHAGRPGGWDGESPQVGGLKKEFSHRLTRVCVTTGRDTHGSHARPSGRCSRRRRRIGSRS